MQAPGYEIIGNDIMQGGRLVESLPTRPAALSRALELHKADAAGKPLPTATGARQLAALPWGSAIRVRPAGSWLASWTPQAATLLHAARGIAQLTREQLEAGYVREDSQAFGPTGSELVKSSAVAEMVRSEEPILDQSNRTRFGTTYTVKNADGEQTVYGEAEFAELFEIVEASTKRSGAKASPSKGDT